MMVRERWMVVAIVVGWACVAPCQSTSHRNKSKTKAVPATVVVQPDKGAPPDQAVQPDASAPLAQSPNYDPPPPPPREPDPEPPPPAALPQVASPAPIPEEWMIPGGQKPPPVRFMTAEEKQLEQESSRLLTLVRELKEEVTKAGINTLSLSALRKADEIQRLSKNLKERLRLQLQPSPTKTQ